MRPNVSRPLAKLTLLILPLLAVRAVYGQGALEELEQKLGRPSRAAGKAVVDAEPGYLGLVADELGDGRDIVVLSVREESPAAAAGLRTGDRITEINGRAIRSLDELAAALSGLAAGERVQLVFVRDGRRQSIVATLNRRPGSGSTSREPTAELPSPPPPPEPEGATRPTGRPSLGVQLAPLTDETRRRFDLAVRRGAVVVAVYAGLPADRAGITTGCVIVAVDGRRVDSPDDLIDYLSKAASRNEVEITYYDGAELLRRNVRLGNSPPRAERGPVPPESTAPATEDRPALRRLEGLIDRLAPIGSPVPSDERGGADIATLKRQVAALQRQVDELQRRVAELEARLP